MKNIYQTGILLLPTGGSTPQGNETGQQNKFRYHANFIRATLIGRLPHPGTRTRCCPFRSEKGLPGFGKAVASRSVSPACPSGPKAIRREIQANHRCLQAHFQGFEIQGKGVSSSPGLSGRRATTCRTEEKQCRSEREGSNIPRGSSFNKKSVASPSAGVAFSRRPDHSKDCMVPHRPGYMRSGHQLCAQFRCPLPKIFAFFP